MTKAELLESQELSHARYAEQSRYAEMCGHLATASIIAMGAAIFFGSATDTRAIVGVLVFMAISGIALLLARRFDKKASALKAKYRRYEYVLKRYR